MPVGGLLHGVGGDSERAGQVADFGQRQRGVQGVAKQLLRMSALVSGVRRDDVLDIVDGLRAK